MRDLWQNAQDASFPRACPGDWMTSRNVLFVSRQRMVGGINGSSAYLLDLARAVRSAGMTPHLLQPSPDVAGRWPVLSMRPEMAVFASHRVRGLMGLGRRCWVTRPRVYFALGIALLRWLARSLGLGGTWVIDRPMPYAIAQPWGEADHRWLRRAAWGLGRVDIVIADYMFCTDGFADVPGVPTAIIMHDLFHARTGGTSDSVVSVDRETEIALLSRADTVIAIQSAEAEFLRREVPGVEIILAPLAVRSVPMASAGEEGRLLFVGSNTAPNVVGLEWFCTHVWPLVRIARPSAILEVAGTVSRGIAFRVPDGVRMLGLVDDLAPLYAQASVVVSPLTFGSGLKIKLVEAMAQGKAVVATSVTVQGVGDICASAVRVADMPEQFAAAIAALDADRTKRLALAEAALAVVSDHFAPERCHAPFVAWLKRSCGGGEAQGLAIPPADQNAAVAEKTTVDPAIDEPFLVEEKFG